MKYGWGYHKAMAVGEHGLPSKVARASKFAMSLLCEVTLAAIGF